MMSTIFRAAIAALFVLSAQRLLAADNAANSAPIPQVEVNGKTLNKENHDYDDMLKAMSMFEEYRAAHPDAYLRFRIFPRGKNVDMSTLKVFISGAGERVLVDVAPDGSFELPIVDRLRKTDAKVRANYSDGDLGWTVQIKRRNDPPNRRVLGDIRWECKLDVYGAHLRRSFLAPSGYLLKAQGLICESKRVMYGVFSEHPLFSVHLRDGERTASLLSDRLYEPHGPASVMKFLVDGNIIQDRRYFPPLFDKNWSDDTILSIEYMDDSIQEAEK